MPLDIFEDLSGVLLREDLEGNPVCDVFEPPYAPTISELNSLDARAIEAAENPVDWATLFNGHVNNGLQSSYGRVSRNPHYLARPGYRQRNPHVDMSRISVRRGTWFRSE